MDIEAEPAKSLPGKRRLSLVKRLFFTLIMLSLFLAILEGALRVVGFRHESKPRVRAAGVLQADMFRGSPEARWEPTPGVAGFNADGFLGPLLPIPRQAHTPRLALLGDSCTHWGDPPYGVVLRELLARRWGEPVEVLNAGVAGYSSEQGLYRLQYRVAVYKPDIVILYFGWNDHVIGTTPPDYVLMQPPGSRTTPLLGKLSDWRTVQGFNLLSDLLKTATARQYFLRVPLDRFGANLNALVAQVRAIPARPVLVTGPTSMTDASSADEFGLNYRYHKELGFSCPKVLHDRYMEKVRQVARMENVLLVDAAQEFGTGEGLMMADHIHLTPAGIARLARLLDLALGDKPTPNNLPKTETP